MEASGVTPHVAVHAPDLAELLSQPGPFLSVYLATEAEIDNAAQREQLRWKNAREEAATKGADEATLTAIDGLVGNAHLEGQTLAVVAREGKAVHIDHHPEPPTRDLVRWAPLPSIGPLVEWRQLQLPHVMVVADRTGADLIGVTSAGAEIDLHVSGDDTFPVAKSKPGGWSQPRYQQRAENTWEHNAGDVATRLGQLVDAVEARVIVLAGDVRAVALIQDAVPDTLRDLIRVVEGDTDEIANAAVRLVATEAAADTVALLQKFKEEKGQHDRAADGVAATIAALAKAQVEVLLVHDDPDDDRTAWFGPEPGHVALTEDDVRGMGAEQVTQGRLVDVLLRAALGTGAGVRIVPSTTATDGVGAILRWAD